MWILFHQHTSCNKHNNCELWYNLTRVRIFFSKHDRRKHEVLWNVHSKTICSNHWKHMTHNTWPQRWTRSGCKVMPRKCVFIETKVMWYITCILWLFWGKSMEYFVKIFLHLAIKNTLFNFLNYNSRWKNGWKSKILIKSISIVNDNMTFMDEYHPQYYIKFYLNYHMTFAIVFCTSFESHIIKFHKGWFEVCLDIEGEICKHFELDIYNLMWFHISF